MKYLCVTFLCLSFAVLETYAGEVSFIEPCHIDDKKCLLNSAKKAMTHIVNENSVIGIPSFKPLVLKNVKGDNGDFKISFEDLVIENIPKCEIIEIERPDKHTINIVLLCPITATGTYKADGKLLFVDIEGHGGFEIKAGKVKFVISAHLKDTEKNGEHYYKVGSFDFDYEALEKVHFKFDNLFKGNKEKADAVDTILDKSWKEVIYGPGRPIVMEIIKRMVRVVEKVISYIPSSQLELV